MRARGWTWRELQETPQNVLDYMDLMDRWQDKATQAAALLAAPDDAVN